MMCCIVRLGALQQSQYSNIIDQGASFCPDKFKKIMRIYIKETEIRLTATPNAQKWGLCELIKR